MHHGGGADAEHGWSVGQVADLAGLSVRSLQFYDRIGLLPAGRDRAGRRRYRAADVTRLQQIQLLTGAGFRLDQVAAQLDAQVDQPLAEVYAAQAELLELHELRLRCRRTVLGAVAEVLAEHPGARVPAAALAAVMNLDRTLLRHPEAALPGAAPAPDEPTVQRVLGVYFAWKAAAARALVLLENGIGPTDASARRLWRSYARELDQLLDGEDDLLRMHTDHAGRTERWPEHDRELHEATQDYLQRCHRLHGTPGRGGLG